jgi:serine/threonine protein kinase
MPMRLLVVDGADVGSFFLLPAAGSILIGNHDNAVGISLHDLYVARAHCDILVADGQVEVNPRPTPSGTRINGKTVARQALKPGEVLRVGNSYLRLESTEDSSVWGTGDPIKAAGVPGTLPRFDGAGLDKLSGKTLGHFELGSVLGHGRSGVVFRARDVKSGQEFAVKVLDPDFPQNDEEMQTFIRALKQRKVLSNPHLVMLHGAGKAGPYCWMATELVEGETVTQAIQRQANGKKAPWRQALKTALDVGKALVYLHENHIRHGNLTPNNLLTGPNGHGTKLNDALFVQALAGSGLEKKIAAKDDLTNLPYRAPEQVAPGNAWVDDLSDEYSLGVVVYALLVGRPPFAGSSRDEVLRQIQEDLPAKPRKLNKTIPDEFQAALLKVLAKRPEERYPSAAALVAELTTIAGLRGD